MSEEEPSKIEKVMYYVTGGLNGVSLIPYIILFLEIILYESNWGITVQFIVQLIINSIIHSFAYLIDSFMTKNAYMCVLQSFLSQYTVIVHMFIITSIFFIALALFKIPDKFEQYRNIIRVCLILFCWLFPLIFSILMNYDFFSDLNMEEWEFYFCWSESTLSTVLFPIISFLGYIICIIITCTLQNTVRIAVSCVDTSEFEDRYDKKLKGYALVMWISFVLTILSAIWVTLFSTNKPLIQGTIGSIINDILTCICTIGENVMFPTIVIVFGFNYKRWNKLLGLICCRKQKTTLNTSVGLVNLTVEDVMINDAPDD